jgi:hypothetical protein
MNSTRKNNKKKNGNRNGNGKLKGIKQGAGRSVAQAFQKTSPKSIRAAFDAFSTTHLALPRATGGYLTVRTTDICSGTEVMNLFGPIGRKDSIAFDWTNISRMSSVAAGAAINGAANTKVDAFDSMTSTGFTRSKAVPAAFSVQVMNPEALQTTTGMVYIGRAKNVLNLADDTRTYTALGVDLVSYTNPRLCSAAKLAMRGVQVDAIPYNMSELANFRGVQFQSDAATYTWDTTDNFDYEGFAPIFVYNPDGVDLQYLVCCEWRVRFDPDYPAHAAHTFHPPSSDEVWSKATELFDCEGNGARDIVERVALTGNY